MFSKKRLHDDGAAISGWFKKHKLAVEIGVGVAAAAIAVGSAGLALVTGGGSLVAGAEAEAALFASETAFLLEDAAIVGGEAELEASVTISEGLAAEGEGSSFANLFGRGVAGGEAMIGEAEEKVGLFINNSARAALGSETVDSAITLGTRVKKVYDTIAKISGIITAGKLGYQGLQSINNGGSAQQVSQGPGPALPRDDPATVDTPTENPPEEKKLSYQDNDTKDIPNNLPYGASYDRYVGDAQDYNGHARNNDGSIIPYVQMSMGGVNAQSDLAYGHSSGHSYIDSGIPASTFYQ